MKTLNDRLFVIKRTLSLTTGTVDRYCYLYHILSINGVLSLEIATLLPYFTLEAILKLHVCRTIHKIF